MSCLSYLCAEMTDHEVNACGATMKGGGREVVVFTCDSATLAADDFDNDTLINQDISDGKAVLYSEIKVGWAAPSPVDQGTSYIAGNLPKTVTNDWSGTWMDENVSTTNDAAYQSINATSGFNAGALLIKNADEDVDGLLIVPTSGGILFKGGLVNPDDTTDDVHYEYTFVYKSTESPKVQTLPTGIFNT